MCKDYCIFDVVFICFRRIFLRGLFCDLSFFCDRIDDLIIAAGKRGSACTGFLDTEHQKYASDYLKRNIGRLHGIRYLFYGGYSGAERRMLVLYDPSFCSYFYSCGRCVKVPDGADFSAVVSECCIYDDINFKNLNGNEKSRIDDLSSNISVSDGWVNFLLKVTVRRQFAWDLGLLQSAAAAMQNLIIVHIWERFLHWAFRGIQ